MDSKSAAPPIPIPLEGTNGTRWQGLLEVFQAFHKWTNTYQPAATVKQTFFGRPASRLCSLHRDYPEHRHLLLQRALPACLPGWRRVLEVAFGSDGTDEVPLRSLIQRSAPDAWEPVLDDVHLGFESPTGDRVMVRATLEQFPQAPPQACFTLIAPKERADFLMTLLTQIEAWMDAHPHLQGAKLDSKGEFLSLGRAYGWEDIVLAPPVRAQVEQHIVQFFARLPRYQAYGLPCKRGILLTGPPGTGKTLLGKVLCCTLPATFIWVSPGEVTGPEQLQHLFTMARELRPTVLFLEDLDLYASRRGGGGEAVLGELLNQLDGFPTNSGIVFLATTNDPQAIEPALADRPSRFDHAIALEFPALPDREALLGRFLRHLPHPVACLPELAATSAGLSGAHLQELVQRAVQAALDAQPLGIQEPPDLTGDHLRQALLSIRQQRPERPGFYL